MAVGLFVKPAQSQVSLVPRAGLVISRTITIRAGVYRIPASRSLDSVVLVIRGHDIVVDLAGTRMIGAAETEAADRASGVAILVDGGANITIKNAHIRGYKVAILARGTH